MFTWFKVVNLTHRLQYGSRNERTAAMNALTALGRSCVPELCRFLKRNCTPKRGASPDGLKSATVVLGSIGDHRATPTLLFAALNGSAPVAESATRSLGSIPHDSSYSCLEAILNQKRLDVEIRRAAVISLRRLGGEMAFQLLSKAFEDNSLREAAHEALKHIDPQRAQPFLAADEERKAVETKPAERADVSRGAIVARAHEGEEIRSADNLRSAEETVKLLLEMNSSTSNFTKAEIESDYSGCVNSWKSGWLFEGTGPEVCGLILKNLREFSKREDFKCFKVATLKTGGGKVLSQVNTILDEPLRFWGVRVWRHVGSFFVCGNKEFKIYSKGYLPQMNALEKIKRLISPQILATGIINRDRIVIPPPASDEHLASYEYDHLKYNSHEFSELHRRFLQTWNGIDLDVIAFLGAPPTAPGIRSIDDYYIECLRFTPIAVDRDGYRYVEDGNGAIWKRSSPLSLPQHQFVEKVSGSLNEFVDEYVLGECAGSFFRVDWIPKLAANGFTNTKCEFCGIQSNGARFGAIPAYFGIMRMRYACDGCLKVYDEKMFETVKSLPKGISREEELRAVRKLEEDAGRFVIQKTSGGAHG